MINSQFFFTPPLPLPSPPRTHPLSRSTSLPFFRHLFLYFSFSPLLPFSPFASLFLIRLFSFSLSLFLFSLPPPRIWRHLEPAKMFSQENIFFSDCVLRHMHEYRFIAHFDPDEVPILPRHESLPGLVADLLRYRLPTYKYLEVPREEY